MYRRLDAAMPDIEEKLRGLTPEDWNKIRENSEKRLRERFPWVYKKARGFGIF
jgi:hypothetical protein